ncbi:hypothetical protein [Nocardia sp. AG03]|uniref:NACHT domain-containing protein n=1 Tax=Nocardia sp. AG03 TaxID=3025312 RepID=UPI00241872C6|nr:hypothetical protein [Nocardia sp. AG03]
MQYDYERLNPDRFQDMCQALLVAELPDVQCYPVGQSDGGRDATSPSVGAGNGMTIFQVKFKRERLKGDDPYSYVKKAIHAEQENIARLAKLGANKYILMTNLGGSSKPERGAMDKARKYLDSALPATMKGMIWWRTDIDARLNATDVVKWNFPEILTSSDLFRELIENALESRNGREIAIRNYVSSQYDKDRHVKFKQADLQASSLFALFIDVGIRPDVFRFNGAASLQSLEGAFSGGGIEAPFVHRRPEIGGATFLLKMPQVTEAITRIVVEGGPGQGKSTLAQYVCQVQRVKLLGLSDRELIPTEHFDTPLRVPFKVDLRDLSSWIKRKDPISGADLPSDLTLSLETFLAAQVSHLSGGLTYTVDDLHSFLSRNPSLIFLDGLDEVASHVDRKGIVDVVNAASHRIKQSSPLTQIVVTSRPAAVANTPKFESNTWNYLALDAVSENLLFDYIERWGEAKALGDRAITEIRQILSEKLSSDHIRDLAHNAMQLTILLSLIHTRGQSLPDHRTELYSNYIDIYFNREAEKNSVVRDYRQLLIDLHGFIGWKIHASAESRRDNGSVSTDRLTALINEFLRGRDHGDIVALELFDGLVDRIVMIVSRVEGMFEFEVQPLREYFAAYHLYHTSPYSPSGRPMKGTKPEIFGAISTNPYWFNVARFYAGCYSVGELPGLADQLEESIADSFGGYTSFPRRLATTLLRDRVFNQAPRSANRVSKSIADSLGARLAALGPYFDMMDALSATSDDGWSVIADLVSVRAIEAKSGATRGGYGFYGSYGIPPDVLGPRWHANRPSDGKFAAVLRWLEFGSRTNVAATLSNDSARDLASLDPHYKEVLCSAGHPSILSTSGDILEYLRRSVGEAAPLHWRRSSYAAIAWSIEVPIQTLSSPRILNFDMPDPPRLPAEVGAEFAEMVNSCKETLIAKDLLGEKANRLTQAYRACLGRSWLEWELAISLLDGSVKYAEIARRSLPEGYGGEAAEQCRDALSPARTPKVWIRRFEDANDPITRKAWAYLFLRLGTPQSWMHNWEALNEVVSGMSSGEFRRLARRRFRWSKLSGTAVESFLAQDVSPRMAAIALLKAPARSIPSLVRSAARDDRYLADAGVASVFNELLVADSSRNVGVLAEELQLIKRVYLAADVDTTAFSESWSETKFSPELALDVLKDSESYPMTVVFRADQVASGHYQSQLGTVASVARRDRWAANSLA